MLRLLSDRRDRFVSMTVHLPRFDQGVRYSPVQSSVYITVPTSQNVHTSSVTSTQHCTPRQKHVEDSVMLLTEVSPSD